MDIEAANPMLREDAVAPGRTLRVAILGAAGRMGRRLVALVQGDPAMELAVALEHDAADVLGRDAGELAGVGTIGVPVTAKPTNDFDVLIDFSLPAGTMQWLGVCREAGRAMVIGTTGMNGEQRSAIERASREIPIVHAPNYSVGVNVLLRVAKMLGSTLDASYDVEITEAHHRFKVDAPSGTAIALRDAVAEGRTAHDGPETSIIYGRRGDNGVRPAGQIGMHSLRIGDTVGDHTVAFGALGETITIGHCAHSRDTFAAGALRAAHWVGGRKPGLYSMQHVLFDEA